MYKSPFNPGEIKAALHKNGVAWINTPEYFDSIASTNDYLLGMQDPMHGHVCIADYQTQGKGRRGKQWYGSVGGNLMFSLGWAPVAPLNSEVSLLVGVALADALTQAGVKGIGLKWPNDVLLEGAKLAGVLIESRIRGKQAEIVIGVGLNIRHQPADLKEVNRPWTDLARLGMKNINRQRMLINILIELTYRLEQFEAKGFKPIREDWLAYHAHQGMQMNFLYQGEACVGRAVGLNDNGALLFESGGEIIAVNSGEVSSLRATA